MWPRKALDHLSFWLLVSEEISEIGIVMFLVGMSRFSLWVWEKENRKAKE
jgi:hypothetical protein